MHAQYRSNRDLLLWTCLDRELDGFFVDAYARVMSEPGALGHARTNEKITAFLDSYGGWLSDSSAVPHVQSIDSDYVRRMAAFHLSVARPVARWYSTWAMGNLVRAASLTANEQTADQDVVLRRSEEIRIFRAIYRYETYCHLFGLNSGDRKGRFEPLEVNEIFFCLFDPWEADAIGCIDLFLRHRYKEIFAEVQEDLDPKNSRFLQPNGLPNPEGSIDLKRIGDGEPSTSPNHPPKPSAVQRELAHTAADYIEGTVSTGLNVAVRLLGAKDYDTLVANVQSSVVFHDNMDSTMREALGLEAQHERRERSNITNRRDEAEQRRDAMQFDGDAILLEGPPLGWVLLWHETYYNFFGEYVPDTVKEWGYVIWDERRWTELGANDLVYTQWETVPVVVEWIGTAYGWAPADH
jgi:hypothetical protein